MQDNRRGNPFASRSVPDGNSDRAGLFSPMWHFLIIIAAIFVAEILAMVVVRYIPGPGPYLITTLIDAALMVLLIFPVLYSFSVRPLIEHIAELKRVERALQQEQEIRGRFFDSIDTLIAYMDRDFNFIQVNEAYARADGRPAGFFTGKNHFELYPHAENQTIFQSVVDTGKQHVVYDKPFEYPEQPERGVTYWNWSLQPVTRQDGYVEGLVLSLVDVTERKRAEQRVEKERARLRTILDALPDGVYIVNQQHEVQYVNPVMERQFGPPGDRTCYAYMHDRTEPCDWCSYEAVLGGETVQSEWPSPQTGRTYEVFDTPIANADGSVSKLKLLHDITDRKRAEASLHEQNLALHKLSESEHRQREIAETLRLASQSLTQSLDLDVVLDTLLTHLRALVHSDTASVLFREGESALGVRALAGYENVSDPGLVSTNKVESGSNLFLRRLLATGRGFVVDDVTHEPDWVVYPGTEALRSYASLPIVVANKIIGAVGLGKTEPGYFTQEHIQWAEALIGQAAVAIDNAWLFEQVRAGRERLRELSRRLVEVQEKERLYIARELHDQASQTLASLMLQLSILEREADDPEAVRIRLIELKSITDTVLDELHRLAFDLRPASLDHLGLVPAVEQLINAFSRDSRLPIRLKTIGFREDERLHQEVETTLYRIVQEALTNVFRHARATRTDVLLEHEDRALRIIIEDDGQGFDLDAARQSGRLGLVGMQERAEMLGGTLTVESNPGKGTTLFVEVPYGDTDPDRG